MQLEPATQKMIDFVQSIGIKVLFDTVPAEKAFLPGLYINNGNLVIDIAQLLYPGDILHEAGHIAVAEPEDRLVMDGTLSNEDFNKSASEEMMAIAWSYAAAIHIGIDPAIVLHENGYRKASSNILDAFNQSNGFGVPVLEWLGMTRTGQNAINEGIEPYPHMIKWLRN